MSLAERCGSSTVSATRTRAMACERSSSGSARRRLRAGSRCANSRRRAARRPRARRHYARSCGRSALRAGASPVFRTVGEAPRDARRADRGDRGGGRDDPPHRAAGRAAAAPRGAGLRARACSLALESKGLDTGGGFAYYSPDVWRPPRLPEPRTRTSSPPTSSRPTPPAGSRRPNCATLLDGYLRRLAPQEARARRVLGTLAHGFLRRRHHHDLGFARLRDYTRERLGLSARELQTLAHVVQGMARLPAIGDAFDR